MKTRLKVLKKWSLLERAFQDQTTDTIISVLGVRDLYFAVGKFETNH